MVWKRKLPSERQFLRGLYPDREETAAQTAAEHCFITEHVGYWSRTNTHGASPVSWEQETSSTKLDNDKKHWCDVYWFLLGSQFGQRLMSFNVHACNGAKRQNLPCPAVCDPSSDVCSKIMHHIPKLTSFKLVSYSPQLADLSPIEHLWDVVEWETRWLKPNLWERFPSPWWICGTMKAVLRAKRAQC